MDTATQDALEKLAAAIASLQAQVAELKREVERLQDRR